jgi:hypothetical protein
MALSHTEPAYTDEAAPFIEELGGKLGGLHFLRETTDLRQHVPPTTVVKPGETWQEKTFGLAHQIIRGSHPHDFQGLVDVLDTKTIDVRRNANIQEIIDEMRRAASSASMMEYGQWEHPAYDGSIIVGVQPFTGAAASSEGYRRGSVVEHPNRPGHLMMEWIEEIEGAGEIIRSGLYNESGHVIREFGLTHIHEIHRQRLADIYGRIKRSGLVRDDVSFQMEFGQLTNGFPYIYQVRGFMRKAIADFSIDANDITAERLMAFGVTSPTGIELPLHLSNWDVAEPPVAPAAIMTLVHRKERRLNFRPQVSAYLAGAFCGSSAIPNLQHNHFWKAQKADVTVYESAFDHYAGFLNDPTRPTSYEQDGLQTAKVRIISDGTRALVTKI